ncbi:adenylosuccinate synthetase, partial [Vibrio parahaemolyticus]
GNNAGHTVVNDLGTFKLHQLPSGVFNPDCLAVLGPGMVISPALLSQEIAEVEEAGVKVNMCISDRATLCLPLHALEDTLEEQRLGD